MSDDRSAAIDPGVSAGDYPYLEATIAHVMKRPSRLGRRKISILPSEPGVPDDYLKAATSELRFRLGAAALLDGEALVALVKKVSGSNGEIGERFLEALRKRSADRWPEMIPTLVQAAFENLHDTSIVTWAPELLEEDAFVEQYADYILHNGGGMPIYAADAFAGFRVRNLASARLLVSSALRYRAQVSRRTHEDEWRALFLLLWGRIVRSLGWTSWTKLFGLLLVFPELADVGAKARRPDERRWEAKEVIQARDFLGRYLVRERSLRVLAARLLELVDEVGGYGEGILSRPADTRGAYVAALEEACAEDPELRRAVIEALLWLPPARAADLAQFAAVRLVRPPDSGFVDELRAHPDPLVGYGASAVRTAALGSVGDAPVALPVPPGGFAASLTMLRAIPKEEDEAPRTWLGDRMAERLIERTIANVEAQFAEEYRHHGDDGEERLLAILFDRLATQFTALDQALLAAARAAGAPRRSSVELHYRSVDKPEEGKRGVREVKRFSTDLCLIVSPSLDGRPLPRRATIIQAKRLYRDKRRRKSTLPVWQGSFHLKPSQIAALIAQTQSSFFLFQGPPLGGRGVPIIPARLVSELAAHQGGAGAELAREMVAIASQPLAEWLTYEALALRTGDPFDELVKKGEGLDGGLARRLLALPTLDIRVAVSDMRQKG